MPSDNLLCPPSKKRKHGCEDVDLSNCPDLRYNFYVGAEMYKWSDDCVQRLKALSTDFNTHGYELCRVLHRIYLYYKKMEAEFAAFRVEADNSNLEAVESTSDYSIADQSPSSPPHQTRSSSLHIDGDEMEIIEEEDNETVEGGEQTEWTAERDSSSLGETSTGERPVETANEKTERNEQRMERESSLFVVRRVVPRVPPRIQCKTELREVGEEEETRGTSTTTTQSTAEWASRHEFPRESISSEVLSSTEAPMLRIKEEVNDTPLPRLANPSPIRATTPPPLMVKVEPRTSPSTHSDHNYSSTHKTKSAVDGSMNAPCFPPPNSFPSPSLSSPPPSTSSAPSVDHPSISASISLGGTHSITQKAMAIQLDEISKLIIQVNGIKEMASDRGVYLGNLSAPLFSICSDGSPLSLHKLKSECRRVSDEVGSLEMELNHLAIPSEDYLRVNNDKVREEIEKIWKAVKEQIEEEKEKGKKTRTVGREKKNSEGQRTPTIKRKESKVSRISLKAKEMAAKTAEKRSRPDSILPAEKTNNSKRRRMGEKREDMERRRTNEEPSTSRGRKHGETERRARNLWCAFCRRTASHVAIDCSVYKTYEERQKRRMELNLCYHCLDVYDPPSCNRPEHKRKCPHCHRHDSHPSLCRILTLRSHPHESDPSRSHDGKRNNRED